MRGAARDVHRQGAEGLRAGRLGGREDEQAFQHRGSGPLLLEAMEEEARSGFDAATLLVMSAVGHQELLQEVRLREAGPYMAKKLAG